MPQDDDMPEGFPQMVFGMVANAQHQHDIERRVDRIQAAVNHEMEIEYALIAGRAVEFDDRLNDAEPLITIEVAAAGFARHTIAVMIARKLGKALRQEDPFKAHDYNAKWRMHQSTVERWAGWLGKLTGAEHSHVDKPQPADDGR